ncbi:MAG: hypothetical protein JNM72_08395 [Deltaproteobacteria bacterium]|jgi:hypothetical protein|nr:hypothetical protein [Deltaproteobacteria bacterium]
MLLRLEADGGGQLRWCPKGAGRGAWIVAGAAEIVRLERGPGQAGRSLRRGQLSAGPLLAQAQEAADAAWFAALEACRRAGVLRSGRRQLASLPPNSAGFLVLAAGASAHAIPTWATALPQLPTPLSAAALGARIGRGPRAVIFVTPSSPSGRLLASLRRRLALGYTPRPSKDGTVGGTSHSASSGGGGNASAGSTRRGAASPRKPRDAGMLRRSGPPSAADSSSDEPSSTS